MSRHNSLSEDDLLRAAEMRAGGSKWEAVAQALNRAVDTVSAWPRKHRDRWQTAMREAERRTLGDANAESVLVLRNQLRSKDEKTAQEAARALTQLRTAQQKFDGATADDTTRSVSPNPLFTAFLEGKSDDELREFTDELFPDAPGLRRDVCDAGRGTGEARSE